MPKQQAASVVRRRKMQPVVLGLQGKVRLAVCL